MENKQKTIWKFSLGASQETVPMPLGAKLLSVQMQHNEPVIWAEVDSQATEVLRKIRIVGTGWADQVLDGAYLGTFQMGQMVFHVYDLGELQT